MNSFHKLSLFGLLGKVCFAADASGRASMKMGLAAQQDPFNERVTASCTSPVGSDLLTAEEPFGPFCTAWTLTSVRASPLH